MLYQVYVFQTFIDQIKENGFTLKRQEADYILIKTFGDADYADDIALLANAPTQPESVLHSQAQTGKSIGLYGNVNKAEYAFLKQKVLYPVYVASV